MWPVREVRTRGQGQKEGSGGRRRQSRQEPSLQLKAWWAGGGGGGRGAGRSREGDRRRGPQGGQGEEEGLGVVPEAASLRQEGLWAGVFPALSLSNQV